jgi:hypothetical protein
MIMRKTVKQQPVMNKKMPKKAKQLPNEQSVQPLKRSKSQEKEEVKIEENQMYQKEFLEDLNMDEYREPKRSFNSLVG